MISRWTRHGTDDFLGPDNGQGLCLHEPHVQHNKPWSRWVTGAGQIIDQNQKKKERVRRRGEKRGRAGVDSLRQAKRVTFCTAEVFFLLTSPLMGDPFFLTFLTAGLAQTRVINRTALVTDQYVMWCGRRGVVRPLPITIRCLEFMIDKRERSVTITGITHYRRLNHESYN